MFAQIEQEVNLVQEMIQKLKLGCYLKLQRELEVELVKEHMTFISSYIRNV